MAGIGNFSLGTVLVGAWMVVGTLIFPGLVVAQVAPTAPPYPPVLSGQALQFPWTRRSPRLSHRNGYITGWLRDEAGVERGFQLTFFRVRTRIGEDNPSRFAPRQLVLAHAAVADPATGRLRHAERAARAYPGLAEAVEGRTAVRVGDWFLAAARQRLPAIAAASKRRISASNSSSSRGARPC